MHNQIKVRKDKTHRQINPPKADFICNLFSPLTTWNAIQVSEGGELRERPACLSHQSAGNQCNLLMNSSHLACSPGIINPQVDGVQSTFIPVCLGGNASTVTRAEAAIPSEKTNSLFPACRGTGLPTVHHQYKHTHTRAM